MNSWTVTFRPAARKAFRRIDPARRDQIIAAIEILAADPYVARNIKAMKGSETYRLRVADYRVIYSLIDERLVIDVIRLGHRRDVYR